MFGRRTILGLAVAAGLAVTLAAQDRPPITGIAHVTLKTNDLTAARQFYGHDLGMSEVAKRGGADRAIFEVNERQYVEVLRELKGDEDRLVRIAFETKDAKKLMQFMAKHGIKTPASVTKNADGSVSFRVADPENHEIEFVQYSAASLLPKLPAAGGVDDRISKSIIHGGFIVEDRAVEDKFYKDVLGFDEMWHGGPTEEAVNWIDMRVPNGNNWLEYMCNNRNPSVRTRGVMNHLALGVPDANTAYKQLTDRNAKVTEKPKIGRDGKWQLNLYDPNQTRAELMEPTPVEKPCCSEMKPPR